MPSIVRQLPNLVTTSTSATTVGPIGNLDDASSITLFFTSSATWLTSGTLIQVSQFNAATTFPDTGVTESSGFYTISSSNPTSSGAVAVAITNVSFRGLRLSILASGNTAGEIIAFVSKQISV